MSRDFRKEFSERLNVLLERVYAGNQSALKHAARLSESSVKQWLDQKGLPGFENIVKISQAANVNPTWLLTGEGPMMRGEPEPTPPSDQPNRLEDFTRLLDRIQAGSIDVGQDVAAAWARLSPERRSALLRTILELGAPGAEQDPRQQPESAPAPALPPPAKTAAGN